MTSFKLVCRKWFDIALVEDLGNCSKDYMLDKEAYYINYYKELNDAVEYDNIYKQIEVIRYILKNDELIFGRNNGSIIEL